MAPSWFSSSFNSGTSASVSYPAAPNAALVPGGSPGAGWFSYFFHPLIEPMVTAGAATTPSPLYFWDRGSTFFPRRAFFTKFLIVSSGPDQLLGIARLDTLTTSTVVTTSSFTAGDLLIESQARQMNFYDSATSGLSGTANANPTPAASAYGTTPLYDAGQDDISNHNYQAPGGITQ
jgi:hypothetical protein